jgi:hypothetical protein
VLLVLHNANNAQLRFHALGEFKVVMTQHRRLLEQVSRKLSSLVQAAKHEEN